jgi:GrpB-like predicted nucleotidyltransferase (UPF0157 family)
VTEPDDAVPAWAVERVRVVPADPRWQDEARGLASAVEHELGARLAGSVHHIGSTSVPGLAAKPVLDLMAAIRTFDDAPAIEAALAPSGWVLVPPELDGRPARRFLVHVVDDARHAHLHLVLEGSDLLPRHLAFRDRLRGDPLLLREYAALKVALAARFPDDRERYTEGKTAFLRAATRAGAEP